jgi:hypothetical protein
MTNSICIETFLEGKDMTKGWNLLFIQHESPKQTKPVLSPQRACHPQTGDGDPEAGHTETQPNLPPHKDPFTTNDKWNDERKRNCIIRFLLCYTIIERAVFCVQLRRCSGKPPSRFELCSRRGHLRSDSWHTCEPSDWFTWVMQVRGFDRFGPTANWLTVCSSKKFTLRPHHLVVRSLITRVGREIINRR